MVANKSDVSNQHWQRVSENKLARHNLCRSLNISRACLCFFRYMLKSLVTPRQHAKVLSLQLKLMTQLKQLRMQSKTITQKHVSYLRREQRKGNELTLSFLMDSGEYVIKMQRRIQNPMKHLRWIFFRKQLTIKSC